MSASLSEMNARLAAGEKEVYYRHYRRYPPGFLVATEMVRLYCSQVSDKAGNHPAMDEVGWWLGESEVSEERAAERDRVFRESRRRMTEMAFDRAYARAQAVGDG